MTRSKLPLAVVSALLLAAGAAPASAHDDARLHVHANGSALYVEDVSKAPVGWFARVPAPVWGVASLAVAASLLLRRRRVSPRGA
jgi:hypothetical protein